MAGTPPSSRRGVIITISVSTLGKAAAADRRAYLQKQREVLDSNASLIELDLLRAGDRLLTLDGRWTDTVADCYAAAGHARAGAPVTVVLLRGGKELKCTVSPRAGL